MRAFTLAALAAATALTACSGAADEESGSAAAPAATAQAGAGDPASAEAFLRKQLALYADGRGGEPTQAEFDTTMREAARLERLPPAEAKEQLASNEAAADAALYTPALAELMRRDRASTPEGELGALDYWPLCGCNDDMGLQLKQVKVTPRADGRMDAAYTLAGETASINRRAVLERTPAGWRIADLISDDASDKGLVAHMTQAVAEQEKATKGAGRAT